jgi:hypothetical protein
MVPYLCFRNGLTQTAVLLTADHYFWVSGLPAERSIESMLRNLCYQLLSTQPALVIAAYLARWNSTGLPQSNDWSRKELGATLANVARREDAKCCLFIDGLDDCEDTQHQESIRTLRALDQRSNCKLCVSSRPWGRSFRKPCANFQSLKLQDHIQYDLFRHICDRLPETDPVVFCEEVCDDRLFSLMVEQGLWYSPDQKVPQFIHQVWEKANGNFLWYLDPNVTAEACTSTYKVPGSTG